MKIKIIFKNRNTYLKTQDKIAHLSKTENTKTIKKKINTIPEKGIFFPQIWRGVIYTVGTA